MRGTRSNQRDSMLEKSNGDSGREYETADDFEFDYAGRTGCTSMDYASRTGCTSVITGAWCLAELVRRTIYHDVPLGPP